MVSITEDLLRDLGFVQQNPPNIWDYRHLNDPDYFRVYKQGGYWKFHFKGDYGVIVTDLMAVFRVIAVSAFNKGVQETQDKLHESLGLDRLLERTIGRINERDRND